MAATYILLTRVEAAFRAMKSPLLERRSGTSSTVWKSSRRRTSSSVSWRIGVSSVGALEKLWFLEGGVHTSW